MCQFCHAAYVKTRKTVNGAAMAAPATAAAERDYFNLNPPTV
jgi:hypothetical protein